MAVIHIAEVLKSYGRAEVCLKLFSHKNLIDWFESFKIKFSFFFIKNLRIVFPSYLYCCFKINFTEIEVKKIDRAKKSIESRRV